jgi:hypothetical protein
MLKIPRRFYTRRPLLGVIILLIADESKDEIAKRNISSGVSKKYPVCANEVKRVRLPITSRMDLTLAFY